MARRSFDKQFASVSMDITHEKNFQNWVEEVKPTIFSIIESFTAQGYKISITWVTDSNAFCVSVIGTPISSVNQDAILTAWSDDVVEAYQIALFKHDIMCGGREWPLVKSGPRWG